MPRDKFTIPGLNPRQRVLADILYACRDNEQLYNFISGLPTEELRKEALAIANLMIITMREQCFVDTDELEQVRELLKKYNKPI